MKKLNSALYQSIVLYTDYFNFQFSYLHTFYKPKNIKTIKKHLAWALKKNLSVYFNITFSYYFYYYYLHLILVLLV